MSFAITAIVKKSEEGGQNDQGVFYTQRWQVTFSGGWDCKACKNTTFTDGTYGALPKYYATHQTDALAYVNEIKCKLEDEESALDVGVAEYVVTYAQKSLTSDPDPLSRPAEIEWGGTDLTETPIRDKDGNPLVNSAGELYDGLPERPIHGAADCSITFNQADNPATTVTDFSYTTNNATWNGVAKGNALFGKITARKMQEQVNGSTVVYWRITFPIRFRKDGWRVKPWDSGWLVAVDTDGDSNDDAQRAHRDDHGQVPRKPTFLDGHGHALEFDHTLPFKMDPVIFPTTDNPSGWTGDGYPIEDESDWSTLSLPNPFA